jgi:large subunit ribosomal protein L4
MVEGSTRKLYKQKGTGNARRGDKKANILRGGGSAKAKVPHSWRQDMPTKMRRLANRNAILAKAIDGEIKLIDAPKFDKPSTKQFASILSALKIDRTCLVALDDVTSAEATSAKNLDNVNTTQIDRLNAFDLLNHRYLVVHKDAFEQYVERVTGRLVADDDDQPQDKPKKKRVSKSKRGQAGKAASATVAAAVDAATTVADTVSSTAGAAVEAVSAVLSGDEADAKTQDKEGQSS